MVRPGEKAYMDLIGRFPYCSSRGNEYILVAYHYDANAILGVPLKIIKRLPSLRVGNVSTRNLLQLELHPILGSWTMKHRLNFNMRWEKIK